MEVSLLIVFCVFVGFGTADYCQDNFTISELPEGLISEAISLFTTGTINSFLGCPQMIVPSSNVKFWVFNRDNKDVPILLDQNDPNELDANKKTIVLVPGWLCNVTNDRMPELKDAYLKRYDANIIGIDWTANSIDLYTKSFCAAPGVAKVIATFFVNADAKLGISAEKLHFVGHSLGAQISGLVGQEIQLQINKQIGRITGLDPAGPLYQNIDKSRRLDETDAILVDIIHTGMLTLGYYGRCGTFDFYPNCYTQPNCFSNSLQSIPGGNILNIPLSMLSCDHLRSADYMIESINTSNFTAKSCNVCPEVFPLISVCAADLFPSTALMGEDCCLTDPKAGKYYLRTNGQSPYALN